MISATVTGDELKKDFSKKDDMQKNPKKNKVNEALKKDYSKKYNQKKTMNLSGRITQRIDTFLESFIQRIENKNYSDEKMIETIDIVLERLEKLKDNERYTPLVNYIGKSLKSYKADYNADL